MKIGNREIGENAPCFVTAELGINHGGSVEIAKQLIDVAVIAHCDAVKLQTRNVDIVYTPEELARPRESPYGTTNGDLKRALEFSCEQFAEVHDYCKKQKIILFSSPWDEESVQFLENFDIPAYKIASACLTDSDLVKTIALTKKPIIMSTGMSEVEQIEQAVGIIEKWSNNYLALLACTATYPCKLEELNLQRIYTLNDLFPEAIIGWSHHAVSPWPALCAAVLGAKIIEAHITLDRSSWGSDQSSSLEPHALIKLVEEIRDFEKAYGDGKIGIIESEKPILEKLRRVK